MASGNTKTVNVSANGQISPGFSRVLGLTIASNNAATAQILISEVSTNFRTSIAIDVPPNSGLVPIEFECPGIAFEGVSVVCPTSISFLLQYERGV